MKKIHIPIVKAIPLTIIAAIAFAQTAVAGLVAHYKFDETSGSTAVAEVGGANGTIDTTQVTIGVAGINGNAYSFSGTDNDVVPVLVTAASWFSSISGTGADVTISYWMKSTGPTGGRDVAISLADVDGSNLYVDSGIITTTPEVFGRDRDGNTIVNGDTGVDPTDGEWHHIVYVIDADGGHSVYVDNVLSYSDTNNRVSSYTIDTLGIGLLRRGNGGGNASSFVDYFHGSIDDVRIYDEVLDAGAVNTLYTEFIPEPSSVMLTGLASLALLIRRRK